MTKVKLRKDLKNFINSKDLYSFRTSNYCVYLQPGKLYHIFNRAIGDDLLFRTGDNFGFFLRDYALRAQTVCHTFSYNLIPNHLHFVIRIKPLNEVALYFEKIKNRRLIHQCKIPNATFLGAHGNHYRLYQRPPFPFQLPLQHGSHQR